MPDAATTTTPDADTAATSSPVPPLAAYRTLDGFIASLREKDVMPPKIDRSIMVGKSGTDMAFLQGALRFFNLTTATGGIEPRFRELVAAPPDGRAALLRELVESRYPNQVQLSNDNGTKDQLLESLGRDFGITGDSRRKAMTFLLHMMKAADMHISAYFPDVRSGSGGARKGAKRGPKKATGENGDGYGDGGSGGSTIDGDSYQVRLIGGGTATLVISESHFNLSKNRTDRDFVNGLVDSMTDYAGAHDQEVETSEGDP